MEEKFVSRQIDGKGIGVIATKTIQESELIIREKPLLVIPWWVRQTVAGFPKNCVEDFLCDMLDELPEEKKNIYMSLSDCKSECNEKTELGIWRTNNFALGISNSKCSNGIFPTIARFNHSCVPNSEFAWNEKKQVQEVRALRKIETGEEITLCYFTSKWQLESAEVRKNYLFQSYGFYCDCKSCSLTGTKLEQDHANRTKIMDLKTQFNDLVYEFSDIEDDNDDDENNEKSGISETELNEDLKKALEIGFERLNLMNELCLKTRCRLEFCDELLEVAEDLGEDVLKVAEQGYSLSLIVSGMSAETTLKWKSKLKQNK